VTSSIVVAGCGSIGSRHARNLAALGAGPIALCDLDRGRAERLAESLGGRTAALATDDLGALLATHRPRAVLVCTPPASHLAIAAQAVDGGAHVFCEKPLAPSIDGVDALLARVRRSGRVLMMGMCYRFHPGLRRVAALLGDGAIGRVLCAQMWAGQYLPDWHPWADYRLEYSAQRRLGGGVLLDSIHSFDTLRWVLGEPVEALGMLGRVSDLEIDTEDVAAAIFRLEEGAVVEVHVDYLQRHAQSRLEVVGTEGALVWERGIVRVRRAGAADWSEESIACDPNQVYVDELREFLACIETGRAPALDGAEGRATLALALAVRESAETGRLVRLRPPPRSVGEITAYRTGGSPREARGPIP
jgi:predicted dehydrogenase